MSFDVQLHIRESITTIVSMDSPMRNCASEACAKWRIPACAKWRIPACAKWRIPE